MIGPGVARELARQRELAIRRELDRPRMAPPRALAESLPAVSIVVAVVAAVALGAPA